MPKLRFAVVGCGAVAHAHLPVLAECGRAEVVAVVDRHLPRAQEAAAQYGIPRALADYRALAGVADAAVLALPHHLHAPIGVALLDAGLHLLVEKPMALTAAECDAMIAAAERGGRVLAVGQARRWFDSSRFIKRLLDDGWLGEIRSFDMREGVVYDWPAASDFTLRKDAGGGVLADAGVHALDTLLWWLGDYQDFEYFDDAAGGVEADCELHLRLRCGARGVVELSRTRNLRQTVILEGTRGTLEVDSPFNSRVRLRIGDQPLVLTGRVTAPGAPEETVPDLFRRQLEDFLDAVEQGRESFVPGREARRAVALIEACHAAAKPLPLPWASWTPGG
jgi:predicted dehydrogenase